MRRLALLQIHLSYPSQWFLSRSKTAFLAWLPANSFLYVPWRMEGWYLAYNMNYKGIAKFEWCFGSRWKVVSYSSVKDACDFLLVQWSHAREFCNWHYFHAQPETRQKVVSVCLDLKLRVDRWPVDRWALCWNIRSNVLVSASPSTRGTYYIVYLPTYSSSLKCQVYTPWSNHLLIESRVSNTLERSRFNIQ